VTGPSNFPIPEVIVHEAVWSPLWPPRGEDYSAPRSRSRCRTVSPPWEGDVRRIDEVGQVRRALARSRAANAPNVFGRGRLSPGFWAVPSSPLQAKCIPPWDIRFDSPASSGLASLARGHEGAQGEEHYARPDPTCQRPSGSPDLRPGNLSPAAKEPPHWLCGRASPRTRGPAPRESLRSA
jgi:hypothetical protein